VRPGLDRVQHLALYAAFHRNLGNRILHAASIPPMFYSAFVLLSLLPWPGGPSWAHLGVLLVVVNLATVARIDRVGALCVGAWLIPGCLLSAELAAQASTWFVVIAALGVHLVTWWATVELGHVKFEPWLQLGPKREDSNVYFRRSYFVARDLGCRVTATDVLVQFLIAPLSSTQDALSWLGLRTSLTRAIDAERDRIVDRLRRGARPFEA
jgi:uncharacterized membrane protein YGL010W